MRRNKRNNGFVDHENIYLHVKKISVKRFFFVVFCLCMLGLCILSAVSSAMVVDANVNKASFSMKLGALLSFILSLLCSFACVFCIFGNKELIKNE